MTRAIACLNLVKEARKYDAALNVEYDMEYRIAFGIAMAEALIKRAELLFDYLNERRKRKLKSTIPISYHRY